MGIRMTPEGLEVVHEVLEVVIFGAKQGDGSRDIIAVSKGDARRYGCPYCGYALCFIRCEGLRTRVCDCVGCQRRFVTVDDGFFCAAIGVGDGGKLAVLPHPRRGLRAERSVSRA